MISSAIPNIQQFHRNTLFSGLHDKQVCLHSAQIHTEIVFPDIKMAAIGHQYRATHIQNLYRHIILVGNLYCHFGRPIHGVRAYSGDLEIGIRHMLCDTNCRKQKSGVRIV